MPDMRRRWRAVTRGEMPDPVAQTFLTMQDALGPDSPFLPPPRDCFCDGCVDARFALIVAQLSAEEHR